MKFTMKTVAEKVEALLELSPGSLRIVSREPSVCQARQIAAWIMHDKLKYSYPQIGRYFGQHHTTILHGVKKIAARIGDDEVTEIVERVLNGPAAPRT